MKRLVFLFLFFLLIGCGGVKYPTWYKQPPQDKGNILYATGSGLDKNSAVSSALSHLAAKLSTTISSEITLSKSYSTNSGYQKSMQENVSQKVQNFHFYSYKVVKVKKLEDGTYVALVSMDKVKNGKLILDKAKKELENIELTFSTMADPIKKLKFARKSLQNLKENIIPNLFVAKLLGQNSDPYLQKAQYLSAKLQHYLQTLKISINTKHYSNIIADALTKNGLSVSQNAPIKIRLSTQEFKSKILDTYVYKITANLKITYQNRVIFNKTLVAIGKSIVNYKTARGIATEELSKKIEKVIEKVF